MIRWAQPCSAHRRDGQPCGNYAIRGGSVCRMHGGAAPQVRNAAARRMWEVREQRHAARWAAMSREAQLRATAGMLGLVPAGPD